MDQQTQKLRLEIPQGIKFSDLNITSEPDSYDITLNMVVVEHILEANNINISATTDENDFIGALLFKWYQEWISAGGKPNTTMEDLRSEIEITDRLEPEFVICNNTRH